VSAGAQGDVIGRVGRPHGRDGSFYLDHCVHSPAEGAVLILAGRERRVERRAGEERRPILRLDGVSDREAAAALRGEPLHEAGPARPLGAGEWLVEDLIGCRVEGLGEVHAVIAAPSCDLLEVGEDGMLVPLVADAVRRVDLAAGIVEVDRAFLGLESGPPGSAER